MQEANRRTPGRYWRDGAIAGAIGSIALFLVASAGYHSLSAGFWIPYNAIANTLPFLPPPMPGFGPVEALVGGLVQLAFGAVWGLIYAAVIRGLDARKPYRVSRSWLEAVMLGLGFGLAVYILSGILVGPVLVPGVRTLFPATFLLGNLIFGVVTALALTTMVRRQQLTITFAPEEAPVAERELTR